MDFSQPHQASVCFKVENLRRINCHGELKQVILNCKIFRKRQNLSASNSTDFLGIIEFLIYMWLN